MDVKYRYQTAQIDALPLAVAPGDIATAEDYATCREIMRKASKNYTSASRFLPADKKPYIEALYALMRVGDDRVDVSHTGFPSPLEAIDDWEQIYWRSFEKGYSSNPVMRAYLDTAIKFSIPQEIMRSYFRAMRQDLTITRFQTFSDLMHYMDGSAIPVGRAMTYILGVKKPFSISKALPGADSLSVAMQLSNFWRDIGEDWRIGRVYLPLEDMQRFNYTENNLKDGKINNNFIDLLEFQFERTELFYQEAKKSIQMLASGQWAVMSALKIYQAILTDIRKNRYNVFTRRARTSSLQKIRLAFKSYWQVYFR